MSVTFDKASRCYRAGELMIGQVSIQLHHQNNQDLFLRIHGISEVKFYDEDTQQVFSNHRNIIRDIIHLKASSTSDPESITDQCIDTLSNAIHRDKSNDASSISDQYKYGTKYTDIPFQYKLNEYLPSSYKDKFGAVYYYVQVATSLKKGYEVGGKVVFAVQAVLDLNRLPDAFKRPYPIIFKYTNERRQPPFPMALLLDRRCYIPGDEVVTIEGVLYKGILRYAHVIKEVNFHGHHKGMAKKCTREEQVIKRVHNLVAYKGQSLLTLPDDLTPTSKCPCCCLVHIGYRLEVVIEYETTKYETTLEIVIGSNQLKQKHYNCHSLNQILNKLSLGDGKSNSSTSSLPSYLCPEHDYGEVDLPESNEYYISENTRHLSRRFDKAKMAYLTKSFKTLVSLAVAACFIMPLLGVPAVLLAVSSKITVDGERAHHFLRISYAFSISTFLVCFVLLAALPGLLLNFFDNF